MSILETMMANAFMHGW